MKYISLGCQKHTLQLKKRFFNHTEVHAEGLSSITKTLQPDWQRFQRDFQEIVRAMPYQAGVIVITIHLQDGQSQVIALIQSSIDLRAAMRFYKHGNLYQWIKDQYSKEVKFNQFQIGSIQKQNLS
jgi:hypothetical protein